MLRAELSNVKNENARLTLGIHYSFPRGRIVGGKFSATPLTTLMSGPALQ